MSGKFVWFEYVSRDEKKAQSFYGELFRWKTKLAPMPQGAYTMITVDNDTIGGYLQPVAGAPQQAYWLAHLQVANARDTAKKVVQLGGRIVREPTKIADMGTMAVVTDPMGATFALWEPAKPEGSGDYRNREGSWIWNELYTDDPDRSVAFYRAIGGFDAKRMPPQRQGGGPDRYDILESDNKGRAGVMKMQGVPSMWMPYVKVADVDATLAKAGQLGAAIKHGAETIPTVGRFAVISDPLGAMIGILQPQPA